MIRDAGRSSAVSPDVPPFSPSKAKFASEKPSRANFLSKHLRVFAEEVECFLAFRGYRQGQSAGDLGHDHAHAPQFRRVQRDFGACIGDDDPLVAGQSGDNLARGMLGNLRGRRAWRRRGDRRPGQVALLAHGGNFVERREDSLRPGRSCQLAVVSRWPTWPASSGPEGPGRRAGLHVLATAGRGRPAASSPSLRWSE